jgi:hypothetical protein
MQTCREITRLIREFATIQEKLHEDWVRRNDGDELEIDMEDRISYLVHRRELLEW